MGAIVESRQHGQAPVVAQPDQKPRAGAGQVGEEGFGVETAVGQYQHVRAQ